MDFIESSNQKKVKQLCMTITAMLNDKQLQVLDKSFKKKIDFEPAKDKKSVKKKGSDSFIQEEPDLDFDIGDDDE